MEELKVLQKQEAIKRLKVLRVLPQVIKDFKKGIVYYSEYQNRIFNATLYFVSNNKDYEQAIKDFEDRTGSLVYHAQLIHLTFGTCLSLLYVSKDSSEWNKDIEDLTHGETLAYVDNLSDKDLSEFGYIGIRPSMGGITRTY